MGINLFVGLWKGPTEAQLAALEKNHMFVVAEQNDIGLRSQIATSLRPGCTRTSRITRSLLV